jgi:hypothetical protein
MAAAATERARLDDLMAARHFALMADVTKARIAYKEGHKVSCLLRVGTHQP